MAASPTTNRRTDLDWLQVPLFGGLIVYHLGLMYAVWSPFAVKSEHRASWVEIARMSTHPWRMRLLFLILRRGHAVRGRRSWGPRNWRSAARSSSCRPCCSACWCADRVPLQGYLPPVESFGYQKSDPAFLFEVLTGDHRVMAEGRRFIVLVYAHPWFVAYLWTHAEGLALVLRCACPRPITWGASPAGEAGEGAGPAAVAAGPAAGLPLHAVPALQRDAGADQRLVQPRRLRLDGPVRLP